MLASLRARVLNRRDITLPVLASSNTHLGLLHYQSLLLNFTRNFAVKPSSGARREEEQKASSPLVKSFLMNSCGLCPESAESASRQVNFQSLDNPNSFLNLLKSYRFTETQITKIVKLYPGLLIFDAQKHILPKLEFFARRIPVPELTHCLSLYPTILQMALHETIIPCYDSLKDVACLDDKQVIMALSNCNTKVNITRSKQGNIVLNIAHLRVLGVPQSSISVLVTRRPASVFVDHSLFVRTVEKVKELGFDPSNSEFVVAIPIVFRMTKLKWKSKFELFGRYGWGKEDVFEAFRRLPVCMTWGKNKIDGTMDFLVNKMGWPSKDIAQSPELLVYSLENRIKPRCYVVHVLMSKGLVDEDLSLSHVLKSTEENFLEWYVTKYLEIVPELLTVYAGKMDPSVLISHP